MEPDMVRIKQALVGNNLIHSIYVSKNNLGRLIGKKGSHVLALRMLLRSMNHDTTRRVSLRILPINGIPNDEVIVI